jgi:2-isopropylmalate synthase
LVYTAFSGSHQDAIKKGFDALAREAEAAGKPVTEMIWGVPYLPIDPQDVGRDYEAIIRVNSQSGKGGVAYLLKSDYSLDLPRKLQIEFSKVVQQIAESAGGEITSLQIWQSFTDEYLPSADPDFKWGRFELLKMRSESNMDGAVALTVMLRDGDDEFERAGAGNGPISAFIDILRGRGIEMNLTDYVEHTLGASGDAQAAAYIEIEHAGKTLWGVGIDGDIATASLKAVISAVNRAMRALMPAEKA